MTGCDNENKDKEDNDNDNEDKDNEDNNIWDVDKDHLADLSRLLGLVTSSLSKYVVICWLSEIIITKSLFITCKYEQAPLSNLWSSIERGAFQIKPCSMLAGRCAAQYWDKDPIC